MVIIDTKIYYLPVGNRTFYYLTKTKQNATLKISIKDDVIVNCDN